MYISECGELLIAYFEQSRINSDLIDNNYLMLLGVAHDLHSDPTTAARIVRYGQTGLPEIDNAHQSLKDRLANDIAYHEIQQPWSSGELIASIKTWLIYKPTIESKALSNLHRTDPNTIFDINFRTDLRNGIAKHL